MTADMHIQRKARDASDPRGPYMADPQHWHIRPKICRHRLGAPAPERATTQNCPGQKHGR
ncbi:MAG: hypothetical protein ACD_23C00612G0001, partial [uncultured bacterium]